MFQTYLSELSRLRPLEGQEFCDLIYQKGSGHEYRMRCVDTLAFFLPIQRRSVQSNWGARFEKMPKALGVVLALHVFTMRLLQQNLRLRQEVAALKARSNP